MTHSWFGLDLTQGLGRMVFQNGRAVTIDVPENELALACAMSAGVWRFGVKEGQPAENGQHQRRKNADRKEAER